MVLENKSRDFLGNWRKVSIIKTNAVASVALFFLHKRLAPRSAHADETITNAVMLSCVRRRAPDVW